MLVSVKMFNENDEQIAEALVEAPDFIEAHQKAMKLMRKQYPDIDPQKYNQTMANQIYFRSSSD